jgi:hypothetical protein
MNPDPHLSCELHARLQEAILARTDLTLDGRECHCIGTYLPERFCHVFNNDHGLKRILFDLDHAENLVLDGQGARLVFYGEVLPIRVGFSRNITIKNLTIDWHRPAFTQAEVIASREGELEFQVDLDAYPLYAAGGRLVACDLHGWHTSSLWNLLPFDPARREVSSKAENWHLHQFHRATDLGRGRFRLQAGFTETIPPGVPIVLMHGDRVAPGIFVEESEGVTLENVTVHHAPAMGFVAQLSRNLTLDGFHVEPSGDRLFSTWVDATHFVDCGGRIQMKGCRLRGQFDDASNIHGSFSREAERLGPAKIRLMAIHPQRYGPFAVRKGSGIAFHRPSDMAMVLVTRVVEAKAVNQTTCDVTVADSLPAGELIARLYEPGGLIEIRDCSFGANRGRGLLLNVEHKIVVENNHFHVSGRAIESVPDTNYWWEAGPIEDLTVRNNTFEDCNFGPCGGTLIHLAPELSDGSDPRKGPFHSANQNVARAGEPAKVIKNVRIEDNTIIEHVSAVLYANGVDGLVFARNKIVQSQSYLFRDTGPEIHLGQSVSNADVEGPFKS